MEIWLWISFGIASKIKTKAWKERMRNQILLIKAVCLARLQAREFGVATCIL
jgi:hypothetical protein